MSSTTANNAEPTTESASITPTLTKTRTITLKTGDGHYFEVEDQVAMEFAAVKAFFDDNTDTMVNTAIPLPNVSADPLSKIIEYCRQKLKFRSESTPEKDRKDYDANFVKALGNESLREMILAANYLNFKDLLDVLNQATADLIKNKSVEFVRKFFGIENDFTPEEEARIRAENAWAYEGVDED